MRFSQLLTSAAAMASVAYGQTTTSCDPLEKSCPADKALGTSKDFDFTDGSSDMWNATVSSDRISYTSNGAEFVIKEKGDAPTLTSDFYIMFGRVDVTLKAAGGTGIVSSFVLQSDDLDEIDIEWLGGDTTQFQSNFFSKGDTSTYDRGAFHGVDAPQSNFHTYSIVWTSTSCEWLLDGTVVRTLSSDSSSGYPQTPMQIKMGSWAGGDSDNAAGTIEWAGGLTDYSDGPFTLYIKEVKVSDYSTGTEYKYSDTSGDWTSIEAVDGEVNGREGDSNAAATSGGVSSSASSTAASSSTVASSSKSESSTVASSTASSIVSSAKSSTTGSSLVSTITLASSASATSSSEPLSTAESSESATVTEVGSGSATASATSSLETSGVVSVQNVSSDSGEVTTGGVESSTLVVSATSSSTWATSNSTASSTSTIAESNDATSKSVCGISIAAALFAAHILF